MEEILDLVVGLAGVGLDRDVIVNCNGSVVHK